MKKVLIPLPSYGFDPSEAAIPWKMLTQYGVEVTFATPDGRKSAADERMLHGKGLGIWRKLLKAREDAVIAYVEMQQSEAFRNPLKYESLELATADALLLPGGHDKGVREYLESKVLQELVVSFFADKRPVAAICHGVVLAARSIDPGSQHSVLYNFKTTSLLKSQEQMAYQLTRWRLGDYYLTYPGRTVESEVKSVLSNKYNFVKGPMPLFRDDLQNLRSGFALTDRNYISARWPGDAYNFAIAIIKVLQKPKEKVA